MVTDAAEDSARTIARLTSELWTRHNKEAEAEANFPGLEAYTAADFLAHCLTEAATTMINEKKLQYGLHHSKTLGPRGRRLMEANMRGLDLVDGVFYSKDPQIAVLYCARIVYEMDDVLKTAFTL